MKCIKRMVFAMASLVAIEGGAMTPNVCMNDDRCGECRAQAQCWLVEPLVVD